MTNKITDSILSVAHQKDDLFETALRFFGLASEDISEDVKNQIAPRIKAAEQKINQLRREIDKEMTSISKILDEAGVYTESVAKKADALTGHGKEAAEMAEDQIDKLHDIATLTENLAFVLQNDNELARQVLKGLVQSEEAGWAALIGLDDKEFAELQAAMSRETTRRGQ